MGPEAAIVVAVHWIHKPTISARIESEESGKRKKNRLDTKCCDSLSQAADFFLSRV